MEGWTVLKWILLGLSYAGAIAAVLFAFAGVTELTKKRSQELGFEKVDQEEELDSLFLKYLKPAFPTIIVWIKPLLKEEQLNAYGATIRRAGLRRQITAEEFMALKYFMAVVLPFVLGPGIGTFVGTPNIAYWFAGAVFGWFGADLWLYELSKQRSRKILRALPDLLDMLVLLVEAGLDLSAALVKVADTMPKGPLREEIETAINDMRLGASRVEAFKNMADRVGLLEMNSFISVLVQAIEMGASIGPVLRTQSDVLRLNRFQLAERLGAEASNKVLVPMLLFIFPAIFLVVIGPIAVDFIRHPINLF
ncbi:MAG TPA: type II secretion system F family protein [bacterium]|nr:type II secretion system F family protein [bacterium]